MTKRMTHEERAKEAQRWSNGDFPTEGWEEAPDAIPRAAASELISMRMPGALLTILKEFARREGIGYQALIKRWLDERIRQERERVRQQLSVQFSSPVLVYQNASFPPAVVPTLSKEANRDELAQLIELTSRQTEETK
jgi:predicted DNA binding CopG/RHH family protein